MQLENSHFFFIWGLLIEFLYFQVTDLASKVQTVEDQSVNKLQAARLETKVRDLESKLELESSTRHRLEVSFNKDFNFFLTHQANISGWAVIYYTN